MAKVSAFGAAVKKAPATSKGPAGPIFPCDELKDAAGKPIYSKDEMVQYVKQYVEGHSLEKRGTALMKGARKPILDFARRNLAAFWVAAGGRPKQNPKIVTSAIGDATILGTSFVDKAVNITEDALADLATLIGDENAKGSVTKREIYEFNADMLESPITQLPQVPALNDDGIALFCDEKGNEIPLEEGQKIPKGFKQKMRPQTYFDLVDAALGEKFTQVFGDSAGEKLGGLMTRKPYFKTNKGLLDKLLDFVGRGKDDAEKQASVFRLSDAIEKAQIIVQLKPAGGGEDDDD